MFGGLRKYIELKQSTVYASPRQNSWVVFDFQGVFSQFLERNHRCCKVWSCFLKQNDSQPIWFKTIEDWTIRLQKPRAFASFAIQGRDRSWHRTPFFGGMGGCMRWLVTHGFLDEPFFLKERGGVRAQLKPYQHWEVVSFVTMAGHVFFSKKAVSSFDANYGSRR